MSVSSMRRALLVLFTFVFVSAPGAVAQASPRTNSVEAGIVRAMNEFRAQHGLPKLRQQLGFARAADAHSAKMLRENRVAHGNYSKRVRRYVRRVARVGGNLTDRPQLKRGFERLGPGTGAHNSGGQISGAQR